MLSWLYLTLGDQKPSFLPGSGYTGWSTGLCVVGGQESLLKELAGLFLGLGAESSVALLATLPPPTTISLSRCPGPTSTKKREGEKEGEREEFCLTR